MGDICNRRLLRHATSAVVMPLSRIAFASYLDFAGVTTQVEGLNNIPTKGPCLIAPKHQYMMDILMIGHNVYKRGGTRPLYFMRPRIVKIGDKDYSSILFLWGGETIKRTKDFPEGSREAAIEAVEMKERAYAILEDEFSNRGHAVSFLEGTRSPGSMGKINPTFLKFVQRYERERKNEVTICPGGFEYTLTKGKFKKIVMRFGKPISARQNLSSLVEETTEAISKLSNL